ncbi:MAG: SU10 major capsid protein [Candidatus Hodarchaeales archaeon]
MAQPTVFSGTDAVQAIYNNNIVSGFDVHKPENHNKLFERYGGQGMSFFMLLKSLGMMRSVAQEDYTKFIKGWIHESFKVNADLPSPGAGASGIYDLHPDSVDAANRIYERLYDTVYFQDGTTATITAVIGLGTATPQIELTPNEVTQALPDVFANDEFGIVTNGHSEGSGQPRGRLTKIDTYTNNLQIIKESIEVTGSEMTNMSWLKFGNTDNAPLYTDALTDLEYRMALHMSGALLYQQKTTNVINDPTTGNPIRTTEGLLPFMRRESPSLSVAPGTFTVNDFDTIDRFMDRAFSGNNVLALIGIERHQEIENVLKDYFQDTNINYTNKVINDVLFKGDESLAAYVNFKTFTKSERHYLLKRFNQLSHPKQGGVDGGAPVNTTVNLGFFIPMNKQRDAKTGEIMDNIGCTYKAFGGYNRKSKMWSTGAAGPDNMIKTSDEDVRRFHLLSHIGGDWATGAQMVLLEA